MSTFIHPKETCVKNLVVVCRPIKKSLISNMSERTKVKPDYCVWNRRSACLRYTRTAVTSKTRAGSHNASLWKLTDKPVVFLLVFSRRSIRGSIINSDEAVSIHHVRSHVRRDATVSERAGLGAESFAPPCWMDDLSGSCTWWLVLSRIDPWQVRPTLVTLSASASLIQNRNRFHTCGRKTRHKS